MASPFSKPEQGGMQLAPVAPAMDGEGDDMANVPRRLMTVKVLYTFDDQNKSNFMARIKDASNIPTVFLDETTEIGVIDLKSCVKAIATASPELTARLGHDYTVYAYDFSEYETPLVGQGMLSWILASASATPNAPADQSRTMVTGRVCKNIMGIFSNGIKETLEVKLKLIPVPTCRQREYVENMERYHNLSQMMPEGFEYQEWAEFLRNNPSFPQVAHLNSERFPQTMHRDSMGGHEHMLSQQSQSMEQSQGEQQQIQYGAYGPRPSSPALSAISFSHYQPSFQDTRPPSQASYRSEPPPQHFGPHGHGHSHSHVHVHGPGIMSDQQEEGPPKKRARVTKTARPKKPPLASKNEPLRVTASTAASVRLHRPAAATTAADIASMEQTPRAPTPRPGDRHLPQSRGQPRVPAPSGLRHASVDDERPSPSPYESALFSDAAVDSADDERGNSPGETPMDIPSSPPIMMHQRIASSAPSSPGLPATHYAGDSGFVSDMPLGREDDETGSKARAWEGSDLPTMPDPKTRRRRDLSHRPWTEVTPGPVELLPKSYVPKPKTYPRPRPLVEKMEKVVEDAFQSLAGFPEHSNTTSNTVLGSIESQTTSHVQSNTGPPASEMQPQSRSDQTPDSSGITLMDLTDSQDPPQHQHLDIQPQQADFNTVFPDSNTSNVDRTNNDAPQPSSRATTPNPAPKRTKSSRPRALPRSQTWSGEREPMSDAAISESGARQPRSGSGAKRKQHIADQLQRSLAEGVMPTYCNHCGEIETPTWRKAYTRVEHGSPADLHLSSEGTNIAGYELIEASEDDDGSPKYRIFKQALDKSEKEAGSFQQLNLCNPCGLWLNKKNAMRPRELWAKKLNLLNGEKPKRKRNPPKGPRKKSKGPNDDIPSDAIVPHSEPVMPTGMGEPHGFGGPTGGYGQGPLRYRFASTHMSGNDEISQMDGTSMDALHRAIQSSPAGLRGNKDSPITLEPELTPRPTRRLLFPSPRRSGEVKSLDAATNAELFKPAEPALRLSHFEDIDKENCPPHSGPDDLAHLFEEHLSTKTTPTKEPSLQDLLKTPTPGSRRRNALTPRRGGDNSTGLGLTTPSRNIMKTPNRSGRAATIAPDTPFTRQLNALLSDATASPSQAIDFSAFSNFNLTPGRSFDTQHFSSDFLADDFLSSDLPIPSSPTQDMGFSLYEDPATSTVGLWSGASIFDGSDTLILDENHQAGSNQKRHTLQTDITVDFAAMIEGVVGNDNGNDTANMNKAVDDARAPEQNANNADEAAHHSVQQPT